MLFFSHFAPRCPHGLVVSTEQLRVRFVSNLSFLFPAHSHRGGLPRGTGPRFLPETARLRGVPNPGEGLPSRVSGQLPGGNRRTGHLLHPPPQQTQEIYLPVHWRLLFCSGSGESGQVWLYKVFLIKTKQKRKAERQPVQILSPSDMFCVPAPTLRPPTPPSSQLSRGPIAPSTTQLPPLLLK